MVNRNEPQDLPDWATDPDALKRERDEDARLETIARRKREAAKKQEQAEYVPIKRHTVFLDRRGKPYEVEYTEYVKKETS